MAGEHGRRRRSHQTVAVILLFCSLVPSLTCFSWRGLSKKAKQNKVVSEATVMEGRTGSILFNGKELNSQSGSPFLAATGNDELLHVDLDQSDGSGMSEQASQLEDAMANEAVWRRLNPSLHCGQHKMTLKAMGPGAADLQLDMGNARPLPLFQVPEPCGYSMWQNALQLVLVVPYDGCNVIQENGSYVLPMSWLETPVKFTCPMSPHPDATPSSTTAKPAQQPLQFPFPHGPWTLYRHKRQTKQPPYNYNPSSPYSPYLYYLHNMYRMTPAPTADTASPTTTAKPDTTITITEPTAEKLPQMKPPANPYYPFSTTKTPQKPAKPYYPPYFPYYPHYPSAGKPLPGIPDNSEIYNHPVMQRFYGKLPNVQNPEQPMHIQPRAPTKTCTKPCTTTAKTCTTCTTTAKTCTTTAKTCTTTAKTCTTTKPCTTTVKTCTTTKPCTTTAKTCTTCTTTAKTCTTTAKTCTTTAKTCTTTAKTCTTTEPCTKTCTSTHVHPHPGFYHWPWFPYSPGHGHPEFEKT